jgi:hypothetical protein
VGIFKRRRAQTRRAAPLLAVRPSVRPSVSTAIVFLVTIGEQGSHTRTHAPTHTVCEDRTICVCNKCLHV